MKIKLNMMNLEFHALAVGCAYLDVKKIEKIAKQYYFHLSFSSLINPVSTINFFTVFLISQHYKNYQEIIKNIKLEFPNTICVIIVDDITAMDDVIITQELFFILKISESNILEYYYHQLWQWLLVLSSKKYSLENNNTNIIVAEGVLSLIDETYCKYNRTYRLTRKQLSILKLLLEYRGQVVSRIILLDRIWISESKVVTDRVIDTNIVALRKMFNDDSRNPKYLETIFGQGYRLKM
ncbi:MAG: winged helix-turn-helix domain-containing protein [Spirochaetota bacterium]|nr:winged helix-turn-helix domain-containing protein [Spirochaetota bacterium]